MVNFLGVNPMAVKALYCLVGMRVHDVALWDNFPKSVRLGIFINSYVFWVAESESGVRFPKKVSG